MSHVVHVVAGVVKNAAGEILLAQRTEPKELAGLWEFSGGKVEAGETRFAALQREFREELGIEVQQAIPLMQLLHRYPNKHILLDVWEVSAWQGTPEGKEGQAWGWFPLSELRYLQFPAANYPIINALHLPTEYLITPEPQHPAQFFQELETSLQQGIRLVQLRAKTLTAAAYYEYAVEAVKIVHAYHAQILLNAPIALVEKLGADGVHFSSAELMQVWEKPAMTWVAASCHTAQEISRANQVGIDFIVLSPVQSTATHPQQLALGWEQFQQLAYTATCPVFALGGMQRADIVLAREHGAQGIAAIRSLWNTESATINK